MRYLAKDDSVRADKFGFVSDVKKLGYDAFGLGNGMIPVIVKDGAVERRSVLLTRHYEGSVRVNGRRAAREKMHSGLEKPRIER